MNTHEPIVKNAVTCGICRSPADRYSFGFQCQANSNHMGDLNVGIFSDLTPPETPQQEVDRLSDELAASRKEFNRAIGATEDRATAPKRYWLTTPVHPEKVVDFFLALHHYWFDESLGPNAFTGMHDDARKYLDVWTETGECAPDKSTLEIYVRMKFEEWLKSSWTTLAPTASQKRIEELKGKNRAAKWLASVVWLHYQNRTDLDPIQKKHLELAMKAGAPFSEEARAALKEDS